MKKFILTLVVGIALLFTQANGLAYALDCSKKNLSASEALQCGANGASGTNTQTPAQATGTVNSLITTVLNILSVVVGILAVVMIIIGGLKFVTSGGNAETVKSAKQTLLYAVIGLVVVVLAQIIVAFVLNKTTSTTTTNITVPDNLNNQGAGSL